MVKLLDLKVCDAEVKYDGIYSGRCGYAWLDLSFIIKLKLYVKYEIARWTYHDKLVIHYWVEPAPSAFEFGRAVDKVVVNTSDQNIIKEEIIDTTIHAVVSYTRRTDDMRKSGYKSFTVRVYGENWACMKTLNISFYWKPCSVSNITVKGTEPCPTLAPTIKITSFKVGPTEAYVNQDVKVTAMLQGTPNSTWTAELYVNYRKVDEETVTLGYDGKGISHFVVRFKSSSSYYIYICLKGGDGMRVCSSPVTIKVTEPTVTISDPIAEKTSVEVGEAVRVGWKIRNESLVKVNVTVQSYMDDKPYKGEVIYLNPKEEKEFIISLEFGEAGDYKVYACIEEVTVLS